MNYSSEDEVVGCYPEALKQYFEDGTLDRCDRLLNEGKEAVVYLVSKAGVYYAAKVFKTREERGFRNRADYVIPVAGLHARRALLAMRKKTRFGRRVEEGSWQNREVTNLELLHAAGASVPRVIAAGPSAFVMEYFGGPEGGAPRLVEAGKAIPDPERAFREVLANVRLFLGLNLVHGDLSAYNILWHENRPVIIDFPQAADTRLNPNAWTLLRRDVGNVCAFFNKLGLRLDGEAVFGGLKAAYDNNELEGGAL